MLGKLSRCFITSILFFLTTAHFSFSQNDHGMIYGQVKLKNGDSYKGQLRFEDDVAIWADMFEGVKSEGTLPENLSLEDIKPRASSDNDDSFQFGFMNLWENRGKDLNPSFKCYFGYLERIKPLGDNLAHIKLKNGQWLKVKKNAESIFGKNRKILVYTINGRKEFGWGEIKEIQLMPTPSGFKNYLGAPIYAEVFTTNGFFEGYLAWDNEERLGTDEINGKWGNKSSGHKLKDIESIKAVENGSEITLRSGQKMKLTDHADVTDKNAGIYLYNLTYGTIKVRWKQFISMQITKPAHPLPSYYDFKMPKHLYGWIETKDNSQYKGRILYDLDEKFDVEMVDGRENELDFFIPFNFITSIEPQNHNYSLVRLNNNVKKLLGIHDDITHNNHGILIWNDDEENQVLFVPFKLIKKISFK
ncbi:hypothetical protein [Flexithrix dorotheae]|uniref:hypothetical protein n=1 Tax=Flexithrix dorotheae TaxID=70993 RepID=UPI00036C5C81|nr:hypothetical protein [Flexithrix dorotheae]